MELPKGETLEESVAQVMHTLPLPIRTYLASGQFTLVTQNLITKYKLHVDQGGILNREVMLLLMGIENPDEFTQALVEEAKLDKQTISGIMQDVNQQVFIPLRDQMQNEGKKVAQPPQRVVQQSAPRPAPVNAPVPSYAPPTPRVAVPPIRVSQPPAQPATPPQAPQVNSIPSSYAPPLQSPRYTRPENIDVHVVAPLPPQVAMPGAPRPMMAPKAPPTPPTPKAPHLEALPVGDGEPPSVTPAPLPAPTFQSRVASLPEPVLRMAEPPAQKPAPTASPVPARPPYSADPYREPIDEK